MHFTLKNFNTMYKLCVVILTFFILSFSVRAQDEVAETDQSISGTYRLLYEKSETYNAYKVFNISAMNALMNKVQDSLRVYKQTISERNQEIADLKNSIEALNNKISEIDEELKATQKVAGSISFLGLLISKATYNIILWGIIAGLVVLLVIAYGSHTRSLKLYSIARKEFTDLNEEFEEYRRTSQENKVKLGRELQTERNLVADLKSRLAAKE